MIDYKQLPEISCIYKIVNVLQPNRVYLGSAKNLKTRIYHHINSLKNNDHHSYLLQRAVNKHGIDNFNVHIIDFVKEENLKVKEQWWLDNVECFYNIAKTADRPENTYTLEIRTKMSISLRGKKYSTNTTNTCNVSYKTRDKLYAVEVSANFKRYYLGSFKDINVATELADKYRFASEQDIVDYINNKKEIIANKTKTIKQPRIKKSKYNFVSYKLYKGKKRWYSYYWVTKNNQQHLGYFDDELSAVRAYNNYITINKIDKPILAIKDNN